MFLIVLKLCMKYNIIIIFNIQIRGSLKDQDYNLYVFKIGSKTSVITTLKTKLKDI